MRQLPAQLTRGLDAAFQPAVRGGPGVMAVAAQPDGKVLLGGNFASVSDEPRRGIARLETDGSVESTISFNAGVGTNGVVNALVLQPDGRILLGGTFSAVDGQPRGRIARLEANGRPESTATFRPGAAVSSGVVYSIALDPADRILIGGDFTIVDGQPRNRIARLRTDGALEATDTFDAGSGAEGGVVRCIVVETGGSILVGGNFSTVNGHARRGVARLDADGSVENLEGFNPGGGVDGTVYTMAMQPDGKIVLGGDFATVDGQARAGIARLNANGSVDNSFNPGAGLTSGGVVLSLAIDLDGGILVGGRFPEFNNEPRNNVVRLLPIGALASTEVFPISTNGAVSCLSIDPAGNALMGGEFTAANGKARDRLVRLTGDAVRHPLPVYESVLPFERVPTQSGSLKPRTPHSGLFCDSNGLLWGTTYAGGLAEARTPAGHGTIYTLNPRTGVFSTLAEFTGTGGPVKGRWPRGSLTDDGKGFLWGITERGGASDSGTVFKINMATGAHATVTEFTGFTGAARGAVPCGGLTRDDHRSLWGVTEFSGLGPEGSPGGFGTIFKIDVTTGALTTVLHFTGSDPDAKGMNPSSALTRHGDRFWGTTAGPTPDGFGTVFKLDALAGVITTVIEFSGTTGVTRGAFPTGALVDDTNGNLWGITPSGGVANFGTLFKVNAATGTLTTVVEFSGDKGSVTGRHPTGGLLRDRFGDFWGTTRHGPLGLFGSVFRVTPIGGFDQAFELTGLGGPSPGDDPNGPLVSHPDGELYGTTRAGGFDSTDPLGDNGQIYRLRFHCLTSTQAPAGVSTTSATLRGTIVPNGHDCTAVFEFGTDPTLSVFTSHAVGNVGAGEGMVTLTLDVTGLRPSTDYYYRLVGGGSGSALSRQGSIISFRTVTAPDAGFHPALTGEVFTLALDPSGRTLVGGAFLSADNRARRFLARFDQNGMLDAEFSPDLDGRLFATAVDAHGRVLVGGAITSGNGQRQNLVRLLSDGLLDSQFAPDPDERVLCLAMQADGKLVIGGGFTAVGGASRSFIARLNPDGSLDAGFNPGANASVLCLAMQEDGRIVVGGAFTSMAGTQRRYIARLHPNGTLDATFNPEADLTVHALAVQSDGKVIAAGDFTRMGGMARIGLARLRDDGSLDAPFAVDTEGGTVRCLVVQTDGQIMAAGHFTTVNEERDHLARLDPDGSLDSRFPNLAFLPRATATISSLMIPIDGQILVGGQFESIGGTGFTHLARLFNGPATQTLVPDHTRLLWFRAGTSPEVAQVTFEVSPDDLGNWVLLGRGTRIPGGWELAGLDLPSGATVRARGFVSDGRGSNGLVESTAKVPFFSLLTWRQKHFGTSLNSGAAADLSDPDFDGVANIVEFGLGLDPRRSSAGQLPTSQIVDGDFILTVIQPANITGVTYTAESSHTLLEGDWSPVPDTGVPPQHIFRIPIGAGAQRFLRLGVKAQ